MGKKFTYLLVLLGALNLCFTKANAQLVELNHVPTSLTVTEGDTVTLAVAVKNFTNVFGIQGTISWDTTKMTFLDVPVTNLPGLTPPDCPGVCSFITTFASEGDILLNWFSAAGTSVMDDVEIYEIRFVTKTDGVDTVQFTDDRISFFATIIDGIELLDIVPGSDSSVITINPIPGSNDPCDNFIEFGTYLSSDSIPTNTQTCLDVKVCGFTDVIGFGYTVQFDPNIVRFDSITNKIPEVDGIVLGTTNVGLGLLSVDWSQTDTITIPDETTIYEICFTAIGAGGERDTIEINSAQTPFAAADQNAMDLIVGSSPGYITITGTSQSAVSVYASDETIIIPGDTCVDVRVDDFTDMLSLSYTMEWDESIITFDTILDPNNFFDGMISGFVNSSPSAVDTGALIVNWFSPGTGTTPLTLADSTIIYQVCFTDTDGASDGDVSAVEFTDSQISTNAVQDDGMGGVNSIPLSTIDGSVELDEVTAGGFVFVMNDHEVCPGDTFTVDVIAQGFTDISAFSYLITWDTADFEWVGHHDAIIGVPVFFSINDTPQFTDEGKISVLMADLSLVGISFADGTVLYQMDFIATGDEGNSSSIIFDEDPDPVSGTLITVVQGAGTSSIPYTLDNAEIDFTCSSGPIVSLSNVITNVGCYGEATGAVDVTVLNGMLPQTFAWTGPNSFSASSEDINDVVAGTYNLTFTDGSGAVIMDAFTITEPDSITLTFTTTNASCNGGMDGGIDLSVAGGSPDFMYSWDNGLDPTQDQSGLGVGTYCVTVTDMNSCEANVCITIEEANAPTLTFTTTNANCGGTGGSIDLTVNGGTPDFTFAWDNGLDPTEDQSDLAAGTYCVTVTDMNNCSADICITVEEHTPPTLTFTTGNASCGGGSDGSIDLTVNGGTPDFTFAWDNGLDPTEDQSDLAAGTYCVTVTDMNNCTADICITVEEDNAPTLTFTTTDAACNGGMDGSIDLTVNGGTPDFTFVWDNGLDPTEDQTGLTAGTYCVTVTDMNSCSVNICIDVDEDGLPTIASDLVQVSCNGFDDGEINLTITGGNPDYMFAWNNGLDPTKDQIDLAPGNYEVTVTDQSSCSVIESFTISEPDALTLTDTHDDVDCNGNENGSINLTVDGGTPDYDFNWNSGLPDTQNQSGLGAAIYRVTVTDDNGCTENRIIRIREPEALTLSGSVTDDSGLGDGMIDITVDGGTTDYMFDWDSGLASTEDQNDLGAGTYSVTVTDMNGCEIDDSFVVDGVAPPSIDDVIITDAGCSGSATGAIDLVVSGGVPTLDYDWSGPGNFSANTQDISGIENGDYFVTITDGGGTQITGGPYTVNQATNISYSETHTNTTCSYREDGTITLVIAGGNGPYTVEWNGGLSGAELTNLAPGNYAPTISDSQGCEQVGDEITINAAPEIEINLSQQVDVICHGDFTGSILINVSGGTGAPSVLWDSGNSGLSIANLSADDYTPTVTDENGCTAEGATITVDQPNSPIRANEVITQISCNGDNDGSIEIAATGGNSGNYIINWNPNVSVNNDDDIFNLSPGNYALTITDDEGCPETFGPFEITEPTLISAQAFIDNASSSNDDGIITLVVSGGTGTYDFDWVGAGGNFPNDNVITGLSSGEYDVTITDNKGCTYVDTYLVEGSIGVNYSINDVSCNGENDGSIIQTSISGGLPDYTYEWNTVPPRLTPDLTDVGPGVYQVTITDANGMLIVQSYEVEEPIALNLQVNNVIHETGLGCNGSIAINVENGQEPYTYIWSNGDNTPTITDLCKGDYSVEVIDDNGCIVRSSNITIDPAPLGVTNIDVTSGACFNESNGEVCLEYFGGCGPYTISIDGGSSFIDIDGSVCFEELSGGNHTVLIVDNFGLSFQETINIPQYSEIVGTAVIANNSAPTGAACNGAINLSVTGGTPSYSFQWSHGPISEDVDGLCADLSPYSVVITDENGCTEIVQDLVVEDGISVTVDIMDLCDPDDCDGAIFIEPAGGAIPFDYEWSNNSTNKNLIGVCAGEYSLTVTDDNGNTQVFTYSVAAPDAPLAVTGVVSDATLGMNGSIDVTVSGGYGAYDIFWSSGQNTADIAGLSEGTYVITVTDLNGCEVVEDFQVFGTEQIVNITGDSPSCFDAADGCLEAQISGNSAAPYTYIWSNGLGGQRICGIGAGEYTVTITDANGIIFTQSTILEEPNQLLVEVQDLDNGSAEAIVQGGTPMYNYNWNDEGNTQESIVDNLDPGSYSVLITDQNGCVAMGFYDYFPDDDCSKVRDIITPNGDGNNDEFLIRCAYTFLDNELSIFNRWGQLVYRTVGYGNDWMGTDLSNNALPEGGYFYVFEYREPATGTLKQQKGAITIVKK